MISSAQWNWESACLVGGHCASWFKVRNGFEGDKVFSGVGSCGEIQRRHDMFFVCFLLLLFGTVEVLLMEFHMSFCCCDRFGRYLLISWGVSPGKVAKNPRSMAWIHVQGMGLQHAK